VVWPLWAKMNDVTSPPNMGEYTYKGIWVQCSSAGVGMFSCDNFMRPIFSLSAMAIFQRSFVIFSVGGCAVTLALMIVRMECTKFYLKDPSNKVFMMKIAALTLELSAFSLLLVASIYGKKFLLRIVFSAEKILCRSGFKLTTT
jgi:purine-nucleoside phosphorylase